MPPADKERSAKETVQASRRQRLRRDPARFQAERNALKKIQVHLEFQQSLMHDIRVAAAKENLSPSDFVRSLVGLSHAEIQRPRISLSFSDTDLKELASRYGQPPHARHLKRHVIDDVRRYFDTDPHLPESAGPSR